MEDLDNRPDTPLVITVHKLEEWERWGNALMQPFMQCAMGTLSESPQRTHQWNRQRLKTVEGRNLDPHMMVREDGDPTAYTPWGFGFSRARLPILGGWRRYVVVAPEDSTEEWHPGWFTRGGCGISRFVINGPVRFPLGPWSSRYLGINTAVNQQIKIRRVGYGRIGDRSEYRHLPLL